MLELEVIDEIISEPLGGAHRDKDLILKNVRESINRNLDKFKNMTEEEIFNERKNKYLKIGRTKGFIENTNELSSLKSEKNKLSQILREKKTVSVSLVLALIALSLFIIL